MTSFFVRWSHVLDPQTFNVQFSQNVGPFKEWLMKHTIPEIIKTRRFEDPRLFNAGIGNGLLKEIKSGVFGALWMQMRSHYSLRNVYIIE